MPTITPPAITALPTAPDPNNRATFNSLAYPWSAALPAFGTQVSALGTNVKANADDAATSASTATTQASSATTSASTATTQASSATTSASTATTQAGNAAASAASAAAIAGAFVGTSTSSLLIATGSKSFATQTGEQYTAGVFLSAVSAANNANFMFGQVTSYTTSTGALVVDVQVIGGSGTFADWNISLVGARGAQGPTGAGITPQSVGFTATGGATPRTLTVDQSIVTSDIINGVYGGSVVRSERTANTILGTADKSRLIDVTSGTFTQTFTAAATLGSGWFVYLRNAGTGDITLDPNASELIDGLATYVMYPGECRLVQCDGTALRSVVLSPFYRSFTASGTFTKPPGYTQFSISAFGAGGGGGSGRKASNGTDVSGGASGGGGSNILRQLVTSEISASETVTVGAGGAGAVGGSADPSEGATGSSGGNTTFGVLVTARAGNGGAGAALSGNTFGGLGGGVIATTNATSTAAELQSGGAGGQTNVANTNGYIGFSSVFSGAAGGGGGGRPTDRSGGAGGARSANNGGGGVGGAAGTTTTPGTNGAAGVSVGFGGGGGGAAVDATAGSGGAGGVGGGGGGGGCTYGFNLPATFAGSGGAGGRGELRIWGIA